MLKVRRKARYRVKRTENRSNENVKVDVEPGQIKLEMNV